MSAQELSDRCSELGYPVARNTITNLENGRKEVVSVQEVDVLARALNIPPVMLLYPIGLDDRVDVLPGAGRELFEAIQWFAGHWHLLPDPGLAAYGSYTQWALMNPSESQQSMSEGLGLLYLWRAHASMLNDLTQAVDEWSGLEAFIEDIEHGDVPEHDKDSIAAQFYSTPISVHRARAGELRSRINEVEGAIVRLRADMRRNGVPTPPLYGDLSRLDREEPAASELSPYERQVARLDEPVGLPGATFGVGDSIEHQQLGTGRVVGVRLSVDADGAEHPYLIVQFDRPEGGTIEFQVQTGELVPAEADDGDA
jgi:transcriptional regulator with XRE-family HTH domain